MVSLSGSSLHTHCQVCLTDSTTAPTCVPLEPTIKGVLWIRLGSSVHIQAIPCWWAQTGAKQLSMVAFWTVAVQVSWLCACVHVFGQTLELNQYLYLYIFIRSIKSKKCVYIVNILSQQNILKTISKMFDPAFSFIFWESKVTWLLSFLSWERLILRPWLKGLGYFQDFSPKCF